MEHFSRQIRVLLWVCCWWTATCAARAQQATPPASGAQRAGNDAELNADAQFQQTIAPLLSRYCYDCHNGEKHVADLALNNYKSLDSVIRGRDTWELVSRYVHNQQMPPDDHPQPTDVQREQIVHWVNTQLHDYYAAHPDPGRVTIHRLNTSEYKNTIRDLVGINFQAADDFPQDDSGYGFDNIGDVLSLPTVLMEKYLAAAGSIVDEALPTVAPASKVRHFAATQTEIGFNAFGDRGDGWVQLISLEEDDVAVELPVPAGDYLVRVNAFCKPVGGSLVGQGSSAVVLPKGQPEPMKLGIFLGHTLCQDLEIDATEDHPKVYEARIGVAAGKQRFAASVRRNRGGDNETYMLNGRIGKQQPGIIYVKYLEIEGPLPAAVQRVPAKKLQGVEECKPSDDGGVVFEHNGEGSLTFDTATAGEYLLRAEACAQQAGKEPAKMELRINGKSVAAFDVLAPAALLPLANQKLFDINLLAARPYIYEIRQTLPPGKVTFAAAFTNDFDDPAAGNPNLRDRNLILSHLEVVDLQKPPAPLPIPETFGRYFAKLPIANSTDHEARTALVEFTRRAYRRPISDDEIDRLMWLFTMARKDGESFEKSLKLALKAVLVSPHFLFRGEIQADPNDARSIHPIDEYALASRLSYFLWSSSPDDELLELAGHGELRKNLETQVRRMMASPKSNALVENFAGQWLGLRSLPTLSPDKQMFHDYDDNLRKAMQRETELLFDHILRENRSVLEFLTADYTFVNARLARFYGLEHVGGEEFRQVSLAGTRRRGVLTQGSILTLTSNPTRTSPVKRGKFVLETLLGTPPPPPPPNVPTLEATAKPPTGTLRQQMELHRQDAICASCHVQMDPIGFGLENFDAIGKWRETDGSAKVDAAGRLKSGEEFKNAEELAQILVDHRRDDYLHCLAEKMLTYALGRGVEPFDRPAVEKIVSTLQADDCRMQTLVQQIVDSLPFQMQRGETTGESPP